MAKKKEPTKTLRQVATHFGVNLSTVKRWNREKRFPNARLEYNPPESPAWVVPVSDLKTLQRPVQGRPVTKGATA